jgi:hypothetical protein
MAPPGTTVQWGRWRRVDNRATVDVDGRLHVARKTRHPDAWDPSIAPYSLGVVRSLMGLVLVTCRRAVITGVLFPTITSGARLTSSAA